MSGRICEFLLLALMSLASTVAATDLPLDIFFKAPEFKMASLSPDGHYLAALMPYKGRWNLTVMDVSTRKAVRVTGSDQNDVASFHWVNNQRLVFSIVIDDVFPGGGLYAVNRDGSKFLALVPSVRRQVTEVANARPVASKYLGEIPGSEDEVLIALVPVRPTGGDSSARPSIHRFNINNARSKLAVENPGNIRGWTADWNGSGRIGGEGEKSGKMIYRPSDNDSWQTLPHSWKEITPLAFTADNKNLYVASILGGRDKAAICKYALATKKIVRTIFEHEDVDIQSGLKFPRQDHQLLGVDYTDEREDTTWINPRWQGLQARLDATLTNTVNQIVSSADDGSVVIVKAWSDRNPGTYYLFDALNLRLEAIASRQPWIKRQEMSPMKAIQRSARDGLSIHGYLTTPLDRPEKNLPLVLLVHGGPFGFRDVWGFDSEVQFLANRGYAVLQINYRGSGGYGTAFEEAGYRQWGRKMQDDLSDGAQWAVVQGVADPRRICIMGASYGGYAAMAGLAFTPELYRCGVNLFGPTDLFRFFNERTETPDVLEYLTKRLGHEKDGLLAVSPAYHADNIKVPVFMCYGQLDSRVHIEHGYAMQKALKRAGNPIGHN